MAVAPELSDADGNTYYRVQDAGQETYHLVQKTGATNVGVYQIGASWSNPDKQKWLDSPAATRDNTITVTVTAPAQNENEVYAVLLAANAENASNPGSSQLHKFTITINNDGSFSYANFDGAQNYLDSGTLKGKFAARPAYETATDDETQDDNYNGILSLGTPVVSHS